jgi:hypothetical protein
MEPLYTSSTHPASSESFHCLQRELRHGFGGASIRRCNAEACFCTAHRDMSFDMLTRTIIQYVTVDHTAWAGTYSEVW